MTIDLLFKKLLFWCSAGSSKLSCASVLMIELEIHSCDVENRHYDSSYDSSRTLQLAVTIHDVIVMLLPISWPHVVCLF